MADITGTPDPDTLTGTPDPDTILGLEGNDIINGLGGADVMDGGAGDDFIYVDDAGDVIVEDDGEGFDNVLAAVSYTLNAGAHVEILSTTNHDGTGTIHLTGNELANILIGNAGSNILNGGGGADRLAGLGGDDFLIVDNAGDFIDEADGGGYDNVLAALSYTLTAGAYVEVLSTTDHDGVVAIHLTGNSLGQVIIGNAGSNILDGGGGSDRFAGLGGDDFYIVDSLDDYVDETAGGGYDNLLCRVDYVLTGNAEIEVISTDNHDGTAGIDITGSAFGQVIIGNAGSNILDGGGGTDRLAGLGGNDFYYVDSLDDYVDETAGGGYDNLLCRVDYVLTGNAEIEVISTDNHAGTAAIDITGSAFGQVIIGNAGANVLIGGGGADRLAGLGGDDFLYVDSLDDFVDEEVGGGYDNLICATSYTLFGSAEIEVISTANHAGTAAIDLTGSAYNQVIIGNAGNNILDGSFGTDRLAGFGGADNFAFTTNLGIFNIDTIADFDADDVIRLGGEAGQPFTALASGTLRAGSFITGTAALDADDYLIYNSGTGVLMYDADGNGAGAAIHFATLENHFALTFEDFLVAGPANSAPAITSGGTATIAENTSAATIVYQTAATDADGDRITYSLTGADAALLSIDAVTGAVRLLAPANFEAKASYTFNVVASDSGVSTALAVVLTITDVNETVQTPTINETAGSNDSRLTAQVIDRGGFLVTDNANLTNDDLPSATILGAVTPATDIDFYSITLQAGELLLLDIDNVTGGLDAVLRIYDGAGNEIGYADDAQFDTGSAPHPNVPGMTLDSFIRFRAATGGTYYFSVESWGPGLEEGPGTGDSSGNYQLHVSIGPAATAAQLVAEDVQALPSGAEWNHNNLTFGFPTLASQYPDDFDEANPDNEFHAFTSVQQAATRQLLGLVASVSTLTFAELTGGTGISSGAGSADLRYAMSTDNDIGAAHAYYPSNGGPSSEGGSAWFNTDDFDTPLRGNYAWMGILHETGHALGLKHGHEFPLAISQGRDSVEYSVMTYRSYPGQDLSGGGGYTNEQFGYPQTLMMYDIAALQQMYGGANYGFNSGNSIYSWTSGSGETFINGVGQGAVGTGTGASSNRIFLTVWDGGGTDTYDLSAFSSAVTIDLRPGEWSLTSATQLAHLGPGRDARGNIANALMFDNNPASLIENAIGGSAGDSIVANQAANVLTGNGGNDNFRWLAGTDAGIGALADRIADFVRGGDKIDLSAIDANSGTGADDAFAFIGTSAFGNVAGELRYQVEGANLRVQADLNGNGVADMEIIVSNHNIFAATDFVL